MTPELIPLPAEAQRDEHGRTWPSSLSWPQTLFATAIGLTIVLAIWLRWSGLTSLSMWADEGFTTWLSQFSPGVQWRLLGGDNGTPLYYILVHYWVLLWGDSDASFRALSALFSTLSVVVFYFVARRFWPDRSFLLLSLLLYSFSFFQIWYAKESRSYSLLNFLLLASVYCVQAYLSKPTLFRLASLVLCLALALYTHNMVLFYLPGFVAFWFLYPAEVGFSVRLKKAAEVGLIVFLIYAPWLSTLLKQMASVRGSFWASRPHLTDLIDSLFTFCGLDISVLQNLRQHLPITHFSGTRTLVILFLAIFGACLVGGVWAVPPEDRRKCLALQLWTLSPVALVFLWSQISSPVYVDRNLIGTCALMPLLLCAPVAVHRGMRKALFLFLAAVVLLGGVASFAMRHQQKDDWRGVTQYLLSVPEQRRLVVVVQPFCQILVHHYAANSVKDSGKPEITGLMTEYDRPETRGGVLPNLPAADLDGLLSRAFETHQYNEIDIALQLERLPANVQAIPAFLKPRCASVQDVPFGILEVSRCLVKQN